MYVHSYIQNVTSLLASHSLSTLTCYSYSFFSSPCFSTVFASGHERALTEFKNHQQLSVADGLSQTSTFAIFYFGSLNPKGLAQVVKVLDLVAFSSGLRFESL
jgi:hypothetical protein